MKNVLTIIGIISSLIIVFFIGRCSSTPNIVEKVKTDTLTITHIDTVYKDSVQIKETLKEVVVLDTLYIHDTILLYEQKHYQDSLSDIWISGISPKLDSVRYYVPYKETIIEIEKTSQIERKWGCSLIVGPYIGYGIGLHNNQLIMSPEIGIGITIGFGYNFPLNKK